MSKILYQFGGQFAKDADMEGLKLAKALQVEGWSSESIREKTDWMLGPDDRWYFFIPNVDTAFDAEKLNKGGFLTLGAIYDNKRLYKHYPNLKDLRVKSVDSDEYRGALVSSIEGHTIEISSSEPPEEQLKTLRHEIQHRIQTFEGHANGGSGTSIHAYVETYNKVRDQLRSVTFAASHDNADDLLILDDLKKEIEDVQSLKMYSSVAESVKELSRIANLRYPSKAINSISKHSNWLHNRSLLGGCSQSAKEQLSRVYLKWYDIPRKNKTEPVREWVDSFASALSDSIPEGVRDAVMSPDFERNVSERLVNIRAKAYDAENCAVLNKRSVEIMQDSLDKIEKLNPDVFNEFNLGSKLGGDIEVSDLNNAQGYTQNIARYDTYKRLFGEMMARLAGNADSIGEDHPFSHLDTPMEEAIVVFDTNAGASLVSPTSFKGAVEFDLPQRASFVELVLSENADITTLCHEGAHIYLEAMTQLARLNPDNFELRGTLEGIVSEFGVSVDDWMNRPFDQRVNIHEAFADSFELYMNGKFDDTGLVGVFAKVKEWVQEVIWTYKRSLQGNRSIADRLTKHFDNISFVENETDFTQSLMASISSNTSLDIEKAKVSSAIIDSMYEHIAKVADIPRDKFNSDFMIDVVKYENDMDLDRKLNKDLVRKNSKTALPM